MMVRLEPVEKVDVTKAHGNFLVTTGSGAKYRLVCAGRQSGLCSIAGGSLDATAYMRLDGTVHVKGHLSRFGGMGFREGPITEIHRIPDGLRQEEINQLLTQSDPGSVPPHLSTDVTQQYYL